MSNLPTDYQTEERSTYYVYGHWDYELARYVYIGHGYKSRAWIHSNGQSNRSTGHSKWMEQQDLAGWLASDYVMILHRGLTKSAACVKEQELIRLHKPDFNKPNGLQHLKVTADMLESMRDFRAKGMSYADIGKEVGVATMTAHRALNGKIKNL